MDVASLLFLLLLAALGWFWFDSLHALEIARNAGRQVCGKANVQFLDDTVSSIGLALVRNEAGRRVLRRTYRFEFSETGNSRLEGRMLLLGSRIESVTMEPYQILPSADTSCDAAHTLNPCDDKNILTDNGGAYGGCCGGCGGLDGPGSAGH
ncbi:MAG: DUF3301 domain-containing protein [Betaproteobacteria bacterium]|nr:DUF3301 domain-containing protein [Betaproteobacteria bacterium]